MRFAVCLLFLLFSSLGFGSGIVTSNASCSMAGVVSTGPHTCSVEGADIANVSGYAHGNAEASYTLPTSPTEAVVTTIGAWVSASCGLSPLQFDCFPAEVQSSASINLELTTAGPVRMGYVTFHVVGYPGGDGSADGFSGGWNVDLQLGGNLRNVSDGCGGYDGMCSDGPITDSAWPFQTPFVLGTPFNLAETVFASADSSEFTGFAAGIMDATIEFTFHDADGTDVQVLDAAAPEPATWSLLALALVILPLYVRTRRLKQQVSNTN